MKPTIKQLDKLWADIVKAKAGYKSELSGREGMQIGGDYVLNAHHLIGKPNHRLRFDLSNGICITKGEHNFDAHGSRTRQEAFENKVKELRGDIYNKLMGLKRYTGSDLFAIKLYLENELKNIVSKDGKLIWKEN